MRAWLFRPQIPYQSHSYETATKPHTTLTERSRSNYFSRALLSADCFMASPYHTKPKPLAVVMRTQGGKYSPFLVGKPQGRSSGELSVSRDVRKLCRGPIHKSKRPYHSRSEEHKVLV